MITAKEAKKIAYNNSELDKVLEDISAAIIGAAEDGQYEVMYDHSHVGENLLKPIEEELFKNGYHFKLGKFSNSLVISWRLA